jgi:hypothetical protein
LKDILPFDIDVLKMKHLICCRYVAKAEKYDFFGLEILRLSTDWGNIEQIKQKNTKTLR